MNDQFLDEAISRIASGGAICLTGAGFSMEASDPEGSLLPSTFKLESELRELIGVPEGEGGSLTDLADYCGSRPDLAPKLRLHLVKRLTSSVPTKDQRTFLAA